MNFKNFIFCFCNRYSIDIAISVISLTFITSRFNQISIPWFSYPLLFFSVLLIYNFDHYLDFKRNKFSSQHIFFLKIAIFSLLINTILTVWIYLKLGEKEFILGGFILLLICIGYFLTFHLLGKYLFLIKETMVAGIYSLGIFYPQLSTDWVETSSHLNVMIVIFLITLNNAFLYSYLNQEKDISHENKSIFHLISDKISLTALQSLNFFALITSLVLLSGKGLSEGSIYFITILVLQSILVRMAKLFHHQLIIYLLESVYFLILPFFFIAELFNNQ